MATRDTKQQKNSQLTTDTITVRDQRQPGWFWIDNEIIDQYGPQIGVYGVAVYAFLARKLSGHGERGQVSFYEIAETLDISTRKAVDTIHALCAAGLLVRRICMREQQGGNAANEYILCEPPQKSDHQPDEKRYAPDAQRGMQEVHTDEAVCTENTPRYAPDAQSVCTTCTPVERERYAPHAHPLSKTIGKTNIENPIEPTGTKREGKDATQVTENQGTEGINAGDATGGSTTPPAPSGYPLILLRSDFRQSYLRGAKPVPADFRYPTVASAHCWARKTWGLTLVEELGEGDQDAHRILEDLEADLAQVREFSLRAGSPQFYRVLSDYLAEDEELLIAMRSKFPLIKLRSFAVAIVDILQGLLDGPEGPVILP